MCSREVSTPHSPRTSSPGGSLRRYGSNYLMACWMRPDPNDDLRTLLGDDFERYFKRTVSLKVKKEVAEGPERLDAMVLALAEALGAENFGSLFEVEQTLTPTKAYTESNCQFPAATRAQLSLIGVRQIVAIAAK